MCFSLAISEQAQVQMLFLLHSRFLIFLEDCLQRLFTQAFIPVLQEYKVNKNDQLYEFVQNIFGNLFIVLFIITGLGMYFSEELIYLFAPGFTNDQEKLSLASQMLYVTFPYLLFISLTAMCSGIFNSYNRFILSGITLSSLISV